MKRIITTLQLAALILASVEIFLNPAASAREIPVVGINDKGETEMRKVPFGQYLGDLKKVLGGTDQAVLSALSLGSPDAMAPEAQCPRSSTTKEQRWMLRSVTVGVSTTVGASFGNLFKISGKPRFRLVYANTLDPSFPD